MYINLFTRASVGIHINLRDINDNLPKFRLLTKNSFDDRPQQQQKQQQHSNETPTLASASASRRVLQPVFDDRNQKLRQRQRQPQRQQDAGALRGSILENGRGGEEVAQLLVEDADDGVNAAFDVRVLTVWATPTNKGMYERN